MNLKKKIRRTRGLCLALLIALLLCLLTSCGAFSYTESDLSDYVRIEREDYFGQTVTVAIDPVTDMKVEERILQLLYQHRDAKAESDGASFRGKTVTAGDELSIYYEGFSVDENGKRTYLENTCNFASGLAELGIGSGSFISGFEYGLLGKNPSDYSTIKIVKSGVIGERDVVYADFTAYYPDGSVKTMTNARLDFSEDLDAEYGTGFREAVLGNTIGKALKAFTATLRTGETSTRVAYSDFTPNFRTEELVQTGTVTEGDILYANFTVSYPDGRDEQKVGVRLDLSSDLDALYGAGFREAILGQTLGEEAEDFTLTLTTGDTSTEVTYRGFTPKSRVAREESTLIVKTRFPYNYSTESFRLKTVYFKVWIDSAVLYDAPAFDDAFVTETLGMTEEELSAFEGETLTDRARAKIRQTLEEEYEEGKRTLAEEELWKLLKEKASFRELPKSAIETVEQEYLDDLEQKYATYTENYGSSIGGIEAFAAEYYGLDGSTSYKDYIHSQAEDVVKEKLIFYDILRKEEKLPTGEEYETLYNQAVEEALSYYLSQSSYNKDSFESEEKYNEAVAALKKNILSYYGEEYFKEQAYYEALMEYLIDSMTIHTTYPEGAL